MDALQIITELKSIGVHLSVREGRVKLRGPEKHVNDPLILERVREAKPAILAILSGDSHPQFPTQRCWACKGWLFWLSVKGAVVCLICHPPASRALVKSWYWLPEGEGPVQ